MFRGTFNEEDVSIVIQGFIDKGWIIESVKKVSDNKYFITAIN